MPTLKTLKFYNRFLIYTICRGETLIFYASVLKTGACFRLHVKFHSSCVMVVEMAPDELHNWDQNNLDGYHKLSRVAGESLTTSVDHSIRFLSCSK